MGVITQKQFEFLITICMGSHPSLAVCVALMGLALALINLHEFDYSVT